MRATVFLVFLMLLGGQLAGAAPVWHTVTERHYTDEVHTVAPAHLQEHLVKSIFPDTNAAYLVADNFEDEEDDNDSTARRFKLLQRASLTTSYLVTLGRLYNRNTGFAPCHLSLPAKYITLRVMRI